MEGRQKKVLQNCLPGVTIYHDVSPPNFRKNEGAIHTNSMHPYHQFGYQSLHVDLSSTVDKPTALEWLQEERRIHRDRSLRRRWYLFFSILIVLAWARTRATEREDDGGHVYVIENKNTRHDNRGENDDPHRDAILRALEKLDESIEGDIVLQSSKPKFLDAARIWRQGVEAPLAVIEAKTQQDVALALPILAGLFRDFKTDFAVRSGGYSPFISTTGIVLSLAGLDSLRLNATRETVVIEPGVRVEDFMQHVVRDGRYGGIVPEAGQIGMGGFLLGGGYGLLSRKHGLAMDNVARLRVALVNGTMIDVLSGDDLFYAMLGTGGANFGVVTEIEYGVQPCKDLKLVANVRLSMDDAFDFLHKVGEMERALSTNVTVRMHSPPSATLSSQRRHTIGANESSSTEISIYWMGDADPDRPVGMEYLRESLVSLFPKNISEKLWYYYESWSAVSQSSEQPKSWRTVWASQWWNGFLYPEYNTAMTWAAIKESLDVLSRYTQHVYPTIELWGGAISSVPVNATAFPYRGALYHVRLDLLLIKEGNMTSSEANQQFEQEVELVTAIWPSIAKFLNGSFVAYPMPSLASDEYPSMYWGGSDNLAKLSKLRDKFDPTHVLRYEQSVPFPSQNHSMIGCLH